MKLIYKRPMIFPHWAKFSGKSDRKQIHCLTDKGVSFSVQEDLLPYFNHIEMSGFEISSIISYKVDKCAKLKLYCFVFSLKLGLFLTKQEEAFLNPLIMLKLRFAVQIKQLRTLALTVR